VLLPAGQALPLLFERGVKLVGIDVAEPNRPRAEEFIR
jgi:kynurenine formamidase